MQKNASIANSVLKRCVLCVSGLIIKISWFSIQIICSLAPFSSTVDMYMRNFKLSIYFAFYCLFAMIDGVVAIIVIVVFLSSIYTMHLGCCLCVCLCAYVLLFFFRLVIIFLVSNKAKRDNIQHVHAFANIY